LNKDDRKALFTRCSDEINGDYPTGWFFSPEYQRGNVIEWLLWALFSITPEESRGQWDEEIAEYVAVAEESLGRKLDDGYNKQAACMRVSFDPLHMIHRPLGWYALVGLIDMKTAVHMRILGFRHYNPPSWFPSFPPRPFTWLSKRSASPKLPYWWRPHNSSTKLPLVILHGIGIGLYPYVPVIQEFVSENPDVGVLVIEYMPICSRITSAPLSRAELCNEMENILASLRIDRFVVFGHSYGTVMAAHMFQSPRLAPRIAATLFLDPIPFLLHLPNVAFNFVYRKPRTANEWEVWYFASRDPDVARTLGRHFFWAENIMWKHDLDGRRFAVALAGDDQLLDAQAVHKYLTQQEKPTKYWQKDGLEVFFFPGEDHATILDTRKTRKPLLEVLRRHVST